MFQQNILLDTALATGDYVGFTFFIGYMAMFAATVFFFFFERQNVDGKWKTSLLVSGLITMIAAVHYYYMRDFYLETQTSPTQFRYIDWILTVPLMCVEFYLILRAAGAKQSLMWKMIGYSVLMLVAGYIGEALDPGRNVLWGIISTLGWAGIIYEIFFGSAKSLASQSAKPAVQKGFNALRLFALIGWAIYPIGYMTLEGNLLAGAFEMDLIYNIGDAVNKIGFGLVIYTIAKSSSVREEVSEEQLAAA